jgi:hypothetical protein
MSSKNRKNSLLAYRFEISSEFSRKGILPKFDLTWGELVIGDGESLGGNVDVLSNIVCEMNKGQGNISGVETLTAKLSVRCVCKVNLTRFHTIIAAVAIPGVGITQHGESAWNISVEEEIIGEIGRFDPLEVLDDIPLNVDAERFGGLELVIGGGVEVKDLGTSA